MICPYCNHDDSRVLESREAEGAVRRRRECEQCNKRFTTYERVEEVELTVVKKDGRREKFDRNKVRLGVEKATEKRPVSPEDVAALVNSVEQEVRNREDGEVPTKFIGDLVLDKLRTLDEVSYIRFASVYKQFKRPEEFEKAVKTLA
jgi:transcriptional repressor NrdR